MRVSNPAGLDSHMLWNILTVNGAFVYTASVPDCLILGPLLLFDISINNGTVCNVYHANLFGNKHKE